MLKGHMTLYSVPLLLCWSLVYGVLGGMFFQLLAVGESLFAQSRQQIMTWKRYPQRSDRQYADLLLAQHMQRRDITALPFAYSEVQASAARAPFPLLTLLSNLLVALLWLPFALLKGAVQGPGYVYCNARRRQAAVSSQTQS